MLVTALWRCDAVRGGGAEWEQWRPPHSPRDFSLSLRYPQSNWATLVLVPEYPLGVYNSFIVFLVQMQSNQERSFLPLAVLPNSTIDISTSVRFPVSRTKKSIPNQTGPKEAGVGEVHREIFLNLYQE